MRDVAVASARFHHSQSFMQDDPWAKRAVGEDRELHRHLAEVRPMAAVVAPARAPELD